MSAAVKTLAGPSDPPEQESTMSQAPSASGAPLVSVLMPVCDAGRYLEPAIESILGQTFRDFELLVLDDGSRDGSSERAEAFAARDPRVRVSRGTHAGVAARLCEGVAAARGALLARMDADDVAHPERLERQVAHLRAHPECAAVGCEVLLVDPDGAPLRPGGLPLEHEEICDWLLRGRGEALPHPAVVMRRDALLAAGGYRTVYPAAQDLDLFLRIAEHGRLANLPDALLEYRQHLDKVSARRGAEQRRAVRSILREAHRRRGIPLPDDALPPPVPDRVPATAHWRQWAEFAIGGGHLRAARKHAAAVWRAEPFSWRSWELLARAWLGVEAARVRSWLRRGSAA